MKVNYNRWFYEQHHYTQGSRNGIISYNDTKWKNMNQRFSKLVDINSSIMQEQPFGVVSNYAGFDKLIALLNDSNYTFQDLDKALDDTYRVSLKNAMSRMVVNTHAIISHCKNTNTDTVTSTGTKYYIIDVPWNQLSFGERDEIIRQQLSQMYSKNTDYYVSMNKMLSDEITKLMGCAFICTTNGMICNDWLVAFDDKGLRFKIAWTHPYDVEFIIYKLDKSFVSIFNIDISQTLRQWNKAPSTVTFPLSNQYPIGTKCIVNLYDKARLTNSVPNFATITSNGLEIHGLQQTTIDDFNLYGTTNATVIVYGIPQLHELPNVYPAIDFYDMMYTQAVYTDNGEQIYTNDGKHIIGKHTVSANPLTKCTPPISVDRSVGNSFTTVMNCIHLKSEMLEYVNDFKSIGNAVNSGSMATDEFIRKIVNPSKELSKLVQIWNTQYIAGSIMTSLIPIKLVNMMRDFCTRLNTFYTQVSNTLTLAVANKYTIDEFYEDNYTRLVDQLTIPFQYPALQVFQTIDKSTMTQTYFNSYDQNIRFNRPISEQCFIALKWNTDLNCWVFCAPDIKHFKGIGNTFYIDQNTLSGDEVFKFFFVYTDTEDPGKKEIPEIEFSDIFDFDQFSTEVESYMSYIRYWNVENHLQKLAKIYYNTTDTNAQVQILSQMLQQKLDGVEFIDEYPSDMNYEESNVSTDNVDAGEYDERGPFSVNFLFYTIAMMFNNKDQLLTYFINRLTKQNYVMRYSDIAIDEKLNNDDGINVNYGYFSTATNAIDITNSHIPEDSSINYFYGLPMIVDAQGNELIPSPYRYTFTCLENETQKFNLISNESLSFEYYTQYSDAFEFGYEKHDYHDDIGYVKLILQYLDHVYDYINFMETNYTTAFDCANELVLKRDTLLKQIQNISDYLTTAQPSDSTIRIHLINNNILISNLNNIISAINSIRNSVLSLPIYKFINEMFMPNLRHVYINSGFDDYALKRIRALYIHLKRINQPMNLTAFKQWVSEIDYTIIDELPNLFAANENADTPVTLFNTYKSGWRYFRNNIDRLIENLEEYYEFFNTRIRTDHVDILTDFCNTVITTEIFSLYSIDSITFNPITVDSYPKYAIASIDTTDQHFYPPNTDPVENIDTIIFIVHAEPTDNNRFIIKSLTPICEYTFFDGSDITLTNIELRNDQSTVIDQIPSINIEFVKVGSTASEMTDIKVLSNMMDTLLDFQNIHEVTTPLEHEVVTTKRAAMNYELLVGNRFIPLNHEEEYILDRETMLPGSVDRVIIPNMIVNGFAKQELGKYTSVSLHFKPTQVLHITPIDDVIQSVGSRYFIGQKLYVKTTDDFQFVFPIIVTAIDHSIQHGMIEAIVDYQNAKWLQISDIESITRYLTETIECEIIPDNISNFLDTFSNSDFSYYPIPSNMIDDEDITEYTLPGDPIYVLSNPDYIYTRVSWMFGNDVPNRFIDEPHKMYDFIYIGQGSILSDESILIQTIQHNFNVLTNPELYPVLRTEPNEHNIWDKEINTFDQIIDSIDKKLSALDTSLFIYEIMYAGAKTEADRQKYQLEIDDIKLKISYQNAYKKRVEGYRKQQEVPTTWYNVNAYDDAMVYINNGRAQLIGMPTFNIRDIDFSDQIEVLLYDWEHKVWLNPNDFTITTEVIDNTQFDDNIDTLTNNILYRILITPNDSIFRSSQILIYFAYKHSNVFDGIESNPRLIDVQFKPTMVIDSCVNSDTLYHDIFIRKHYDTSETYLFNEPSIVSDFSIDNGYHIKRICHSGKYPDASVVRYENIIVTNESNTYDYTDFDIYHKFPFPYVNMEFHRKFIGYSTVIRKPIDGFIPNTQVTLICIQNNELSSFNGNISSIILSGITSYDQNNNQVVTIIDSNIPITESTFVCIIARDMTHPMSGGIINVSTTILQTEELMDENHHWYHLSGDRPYEIIPDEVIIVPKEGINLSGDVYISFKNTYKLDTTENLTDHMYYYDIQKHVRYPISDIKNNRFDIRNEIDTTIFTNVKKIKSNYIGICRFAMKKIPKNGILDFTGYIPTPLSRDRYEFWINGRCLNKTNHLIIISPTMIQLRNLRSLRNFELIELVDDVNDSVISPHGNLYSDLSGNTYNSYQLAISSNANIRYQNFRYQFYGNLRNELDLYTKSIVRNPNNVDIETDILSYIDDDIKSSPTINGVVIEHPYIEDLGMMEIPFDEICKTYDRIWKLESSTNPFFPLSHKDLVGSQQYVKLKIQSTDNGYLIQTIGITNQYFTLYISSKKDVPITNSAVMKIIPMVRLGTTVNLESEYEGMWIHSTFPNTEPILIE